MLNGFGKFLNRLFSVAVLNTVDNAVFQMTFQNHLADTVHSGFGGVDLHEHILARNIFIIYHSVNGIKLSYNTLYTAMEFLCFHTLFHE